MRYLCLILILLITLPVQAAIEETPPTSVEERRIRSAIEEQYNRILKEGDQLKVEQLQLKTLQKEVDKKLARMQSLRQELTRLLNRKETEEGKRISELSRIYEKMSSQKAAALIKNLEPRLAIELLAVMKKKDAGKILDNLDSQTATKLSAGFADFPVDQTPSF